MTVDRANQILRILKRAYQLPKRKYTADPFATLVRTIISQNTNDSNAGRAYSKLREKFKIRPENLAVASLSQIEERLKPGGLYRNKAKTIKKASQLILDRYHGNLAAICDLPLEDARKKLLEFEGVGPKTADIVLLFSAGKYTIPVDTHVNRVSKRLLIAPENGSYEVVRSSLESLYAPEDYLAVHLLLIQHGRRVCKARRPLCTGCPINQLCPSRCLWSKR